MSRHALQDDRHVGVRRISGGRAVYRCPDCRLTYTGRHVPYDLRCPTCQGVIRNVEAQNTDTGDADG